MNNISLTIYIFIVSLVAYYSFFRADTLETKLEAQQLQIHNLKMKIEQHILLDIKNLEKGE